MDLKGYRKDFDSDSRGIGLFNVCTAVANLGNSLDWLVFNSKELKIDDSDLDTLKRALKISDKMVKKLIERIN
jgi:hypothetical protein